MSSLPTDREILRCIFEMYESAYPGKESDEVRGKNDPYLPIKVTEVASHIGCSSEMLFGRLYYHLDAKYRYTQDNDAQVHLFSMKVGSEMHCVNFPYLAAVLAGSSGHCGWLLRLWFSPWHQSLRSLCRVQYAKCMVPDVRTPSHHRTGFDFLPPLSHAEN